MENGSYFCVNNGFATRFELRYDVAYELTFDNYADRVDINISIGNNYIGCCQVYKYQEFEDYFISRAEWRSNQIESILEED